MMDQADHQEALYDANEYLIAGLANQSEWWEHLGDAHRDYAALARAVKSLGLLDDAGRLHHMVDVVAERDQLRDWLAACRERANAGNVEIARLKHALGEIVRLYEVPGTGRRKTAGQVAAAALAGR